MIVGVGVDVVDVGRFERALLRTPNMETVLFTEAERGRPVHSLAARFAAKEAIAKALGAPGGLRWHDAEVRTSDDGEPILHVTGTVAEAAARRGATSWHVSLSHDAGVAIAFVIAES